MTYTSDKKKQPHYESITTVKTYPKPDNFIPDVNFPEGHSSYGKSRCHHWNRRQNRQCLNMGMKVSPTACRMHGGSSPRGIASPSFVTGETSRFMPARLLPKYEEAMGDSELLSLRRDISLIETRIDDVMQRVDSGESGAIWSRANKAFDKMRDAISDSDVLRINESIDELSAYLSEGLADWAAWHEVIKLIEQRRKLAESERKRLVDMENMITSEQAMANARALAMAVKNIVTNRKQLDKIQTEFTKLIGTANS